MALHLSNALYSDAMVIVILQNHSFFCKSTFDTRQIYFQMCTSTTFGTCKPKPRFHDYKD